MGNIIDNKAALELNGILVFDDFISVSNCDNILNEIDDNLWMNSKVAGQDAKSRYVEFSADHRTNKVYPDIFFSERQKREASRLKTAIHKMLNIKKANFENWQLSKYRKGDRFDFHNDCGSWHGHLSGEREKTILIYLCSPDKGGETYFRALNLYVKPLKGRMVVWDNLLPNGNCNYGMIHAGLPVKAGVKVTLNTWIRGNKFINTK